MAQIYIVTEGSYSDYHIVGVFSTEEKANEAAGDYAMVETYEVDELVGKAYVPRHEVLINLEDGAILFEHAARNSYQEFVYPNVAETTWLRGENEYSGITDAPTAKSALVESPISLDHARKVAVEKRQEWLRLKAGI